MSIKAWFKSKTADKVLSPVRENINDLISQGNNVLDVGCGTGDLLFRLSNKIGYGLGADLDQSMIDFANTKKDRDKITNLRFINDDLTTEHILSERKFEVSTSTLCLHSMNDSEAVRILTLMAKFSKKIIIADYSVSRTRWGKLSIEMDEVISGHYGKFKKYQKNGGVSYLAKLSGVEIASEIMSPIDGIAIWVLRSKRNA